MNATCRLFCSLLLVCAASLTARPPADLDLQFLGRYATGIFGAGGSEIVAHDPSTQRLFVVNAAAATVDVVGIGDPTQPVLIATIHLSAFGGVANSVAVHEGLIAVAVESNPKQLPGKVVFFDQELQFLNALTVGSLPDMLTFTPDGRWVLVANEGEPNSYGQSGSVDPEGSVSLIPVGDGVRHLTNADVRTAGFSAFEPGVPGVRVFGPGATLSQDLEPEYIAVAPDSRTAYVTLQENNAIGILDIATASFTALLPLGGKDHNQPGYGLDASDRDNAIRIRPWPVVGMFQPDSIVAFQANGGLYLATANEGDAREYPGFEEEIRIGNAGYLLDPVQFPNAQTLKMNANLGRLRASIASGDLDGDGDYDQIHTFGARSITIWRPDGTLVFDSGDAFEQLIAGLFPAHFNASNDSHAFDGRSPSKGPEPEGLAVGRVFGQRFGRTLLFVGLERIGGVVVYDVTYPESPLLVRYVNTRNFGAAPGSAAAGDLGPEGLLFIPEERSPNGHPLLVVGNEVSGTTTLFQIVRVEEESP